MKTLLKTPWLHGSIWIILLTVLFALMDEVRGKFHVNLGRLPMPVKILYIRVFLFQFMPISDPGWRMARREPVLTWLKNRIHFKTESLYYRTRLCWYNYRRLGWWGYAPVAGGITRTSPISPMFFTQQKGGLPSIVDVSMFPGNIFYVDDGTAQGGTTSGFGTHPDEAITTIDAANNLCTASQGDSIFILPGHAETLSGAAGVAADVAGVSFLGVGRGGARPLITFSATTSTWTIAGASVYITNIVITSSVNELVVVFSSSAADLEIDAVSMLDAGSALEILSFLLTTAASDRARIHGCDWVSSTAGASAQLWLQFVGCVDCRVYDNTCHMTLNDAATSSIINLDTGVRRFGAWRNNFSMLGYSANMLSVMLANSNATGFNVDSNYFSDVAAITSMNDMAGGYSSNVFCERAVDKSGVLDPVIT